MRPSRNRPGFIVVSLIVLISLLLGACAQPTPAPAPAAPQHAAAAAPVATAAAPRSHQGARTDQSL